MSAAIQEHKLEHTALTEEDLVLSFTKESLWDEATEYRSRGIRQGSVKQEAPQIKIPPGQDTLSDINSAYQSFGFQSFESYLPSAGDEDRGKTEGTQDNGKTPDHSLNSSSETAAKRQFKLEQLEAASRLENMKSYGSVSNEVNFSRDPKLRAIFDSSKSNLVRAERNEETELRSRLREIDYQMRELSVEKNRLKYFLRKEKNNMQEDIQESFQTRECPCCGKLISKLCFRCEHLYCNVDNCPRKKKQKLNAKMLQKMKQKKKGERPRYKRSRDRQRSKVDAGLREGEEEMSFHSSDEEISQEDSLSLSTSILKLEHPKPHETRKKVKEAEWKMTMSDISLKESKLFVSDEDLLR